MFFTSCFLVGVDIPSSHFHDRQTFFNREHSWCQLGCLFAAFLALFKSHCQQILSSPTRIYQNHLLSNPNLKEFPIPYIIYLDIHLFAFLLRCKFGDKVFYIPGTTKFQLKTAINIFIFTTISRQKMMLLIAGLSSNIRISTTEKKLSQDFYHF